ncbi:MAG: ClpXP protease specificity-enhancing factor SspB [Alphaproteobacteria bacterium]|nr:ClpXP protease specificity-enhancing factor SspB [Alphaproteobacteria bacterium]
MSDDDVLRYDKMVESALRGVVRKSLEEVIVHGLPGDHHFYITFLTDYPGVKIPQYLRDRYPGEMTIVLQYQFSDLKVEKEKLGVTLSFNNIPERLEIPIGAISIFADPSVNFALQFQPIDDKAVESDLALLAELDDGPDDAGPGGGKGKKGKKESASGEVVSLDKFRKK